MKKGCLFYLGNKLGAVLGVWVVSSVFTPLLLSQERSKALDVDINEPNRLLLHVCDSDGTPIRPLVADIELRHRFDRQGTPDVTADGRKVVFDAWTSSNQFTPEDARIIVVDIDGTNPKNIGDGCMPSFSPDGSALAISRLPKYSEVDGAKGKSIWIMNSDGSNKKMIADNGAWGARWSPDGKMLLFHGGVNEQGVPVGTNELRLYDTETKTIRSLLSAEDSPFADVSYHFDWTKSTPGLIVLGGQLKIGNRSVSAIIDPKTGVKSLRFLPEPRSGMRIAHGLSFDWHPDNESVLVTGVSADGRLFPALLVTTDKVGPSEFSGFPKNVVVRDPIYTPDGKFLIASLGPVPGR